MLRANAEKCIHMTAYAPYGFVKDEDKKLTPDRESVCVVKRIFDMRLDGKTLTEITKTLNREMIDVFIDHIEIDHKGRLGVVWNFEDIF